MGNKMKWSCIYITFWQPSQGYTCLVFCPGTNSLFSRPWAAIQKSCSWKVEKKPCGYPSGETVSSLTSSQDLFMLQSCISLLLSLQDGRNTFWLCSECINKTLHLLLSAYTWQNWALCLLARNLSSASYYGNLQPDQPEPLLLCHHEHMNE